MKMWWIMFIDEHRDDDSIKSAYFRHTFSF